MDPYIAAALLVAQKTAEAIAEACKLYQTPAGQKLLESQIADKVKLEAAVDNIGEGVKKLFSGELFKDFPKLPTLPKAE